MASGSNYPLIQIEVWLKNHTRAAMVSLTLPIHTCEWLGEYSLAYEYRKSCGLSEALHVTFRPPSPSVHKKSRGWKGNWTRAKTRKNIGVITRQCSRVGERDSKSCWVGSMPTPRARYPQPFCRLGQYGPIHMWSFGGRTDTSGTLFSVLDSTLDNPELDPSILPAR